MEKNKECEQCGMATSNFYYAWNGGVCNRCKNRRTAKFALILGVFGLMLSIIIGHIQFNYELNQCANLRATESQYGFTHTLETNAEYNSHCYFLRNHPLAIPTYYIGRGLVGAILFAMVGTAIRLIMSMLKSTT